MEYKTCTRCVMNNKSDETITFDEVGRCNYCTHALAETTVKLKLGRVAHVYS